MFTAASPPGSRVMLYFPAIGDCGQAWLNGRDTGYILRTPARLDVTDMLRDGENELVVEVCNTLVWQVKDPVSAHVQIAPTGITQTPVIEYYA